MDTIVHRLKPAPGPLDNPLKGWCAYTDSDLYLPYTMVFRYVSWRELEPTEGDYRFAEWERKAWDGDARATGKHVIFRVYIDYPGLLPGLPDWLKTKGVKTTPYVAKELEGYQPGAAKGESPDYESPVFVAALEKLIAALGKRYDTHPRVAFIQLGLLGFWGEWHTWPIEKLFAESAPAQMRVIAAFKSAFPNKKLMARYAKDEPGKQPWLGYHDDYFPEDTGDEENWHFLRGMRESGRLENWRTAGIGGEMIPNAATKWVGTDAGFAKTRAMIAAAHFSWVGPYSPAMEKRAKTDPAFRARCDQLVRQMGYQFRLTELALPKVARQGMPISLTLRGANTGVAPFYYPWQARVALLAADGAVVDSVALPRLDIRKWQPGKFTVADAPRFSASPGRYRLALGIVDPWTKRPAIRFANEVVTTKDGWNVLAPVTIVS
ncbi:MAG: DUF4832 domain-containing protein [Fibrella sp.]|nr:DUF4832 domain-containing protein [Armatimonadota bacterium]